MATFAADIRHWPTVAEFAAHLWRHDPAICAWVKGATLHHTIRPSLAQWTGRASVERLRDYYRDQAPWTDSAGRRRTGWSAGPHLFIAPDGIWQLTPLNTRGIHAVAFNGTHWGVEVVGQYDLRPWGPELRHLVEGALAHGLRWLGRPAASINGHRDDPGTAKSCPGRAISLGDVRARVSAELAGDLAFVSRPRISERLFAAVLGRHGSPAAAWAPMMYQACAGRGVDPALLLAFFAHESQFGTAGLAAAHDLRNPGNVRSPVDPARGVQLQIPGRGPFFRYHTWAEGAADWAERMRDRYTRQMGLGTLRLALPIYAPAADRNDPAAYAAAVLGLVRAWQEEDRP